MENRTTQILEIRPILNLTIEKSTDIEKFQNITLRPILKLQHDLLIKKFQFYIEKRKQKFRKMDISDQLKYISHTIKTDNHLKNQLIGMITGLFTVEELVEFQQYENELKRRISEMIIQRIQSVVEKL